MKKFSWFLIPALIVFSCQFQDDEVSVSENASGAPTPGNYAISSSSTDGYTFIITVDQSGAQNISHMTFKFKDCNGNDLTINNITAASVNNVEWMDKLTSTTGQGESCYGMFTSPFVKFDDFNFNGGTVTVKFTLDTQSSGGVFLIKSATNCFGFNDPNYSFTYNCNTTCYDYQDETAWAAGQRYVARGNWATYTPYQNGTVNIYAGQHLHTGIATMSAVINGNVTITIALNAGWSLQDVKEGVKIQAYQTAPSGNPSPGRFAYKGNSLIVTVPAANFYGIHLDVRKQIEVRCE